MKSLLKGTGLQARYEQFGGIIASEEPPFLAHVDRDFMQKCGFTDSSTWIGEEDDYAPLSAPLEVHYSVTNRCSQGCAHCYTNSTADATGELPFEDVCKTIDSLAEMKVFHMALGGGEATEREDLFRIAAYARRKGIVPNLTTSGAGVTDENISQFSVFGQVNVSIDSLELSANSLRKGRTAHKIETLKRLRKAKIRCGINTVVTRDTLDSIPELLKMVKKLKIREIELLRLKPSGRASSALYDEHKLTDEQNRNLLPLLKKWYKKYRIHIKIDCSFVPMVVWHNPDKKLIEKLSLYGCEAGSVLLGISPEGNVSGCSFLSNHETPTDIRQYFKDSQHLQECRDWNNSAPEPCSTCEYLSLCKGGCRAVSLYSENDFFKPDPECPLVREFNGVPHE